MNEYTRYLKLDVYDYSGNKKCTLYDSENISSGQASDVYTVTERNGWKELEFTIPSTYQTEEGIKDNYRLDFLKADYRIRLKSDKEVDWFLISEPKIIHKAFSKDVSVTAGHIAQLLKTKNMALEFSDEEGNNTGTAKELLTTILEGTGWTVGYVENFKEDNGHIKYRSLKSGAKTGAFKMISELCDLFDAKPIYYGEKYIVLETAPEDFSTEYYKYYFYDKEVHEWHQLYSAAEFKQNTYYERKERVVDIISMNPFEQPKNGDVPNLSSADQVLELRYSNNVKNITRTQNTENIITKLFVHGGFGDEKKSKNCDFSELTHIEYHYVADDDISAGTPINFRVPINEEDYEIYHFIPDEDIDEGTVFVFSTMDPASRSYISIIDEDEITKVFRTHYDVNGTIYLSEDSSEEIENWIDFLQDYDYYIEVGLMDDNQLKQLAEYQRAIPNLYKTSYEESMSFSEEWLRLSEIAGNFTFCKLDIESISQDDDDRIVYTLNTDDYPHGVIYRSDYLETNEEKQFKWTTSNGLDENGDSVNPASILLMVHDTDPITWDVGYIKKIVSEDGTEYESELDPEGFVRYPKSVAMSDNPKEITVWNTLLSAMHATDKVYLLKTYSINGKLGSLQATAESIKQSLKNIKTVVKDLSNFSVSNIPVYFVESTLALSQVDVSDSGFAFAWVYDKSELTPWQNGAETNSKLYFCWPNKTGNHWIYVYYSKTEPTVPNTVTSAYWYQWDTAKLYLYNNGEWNWLNLYEEKKISNSFGTVYDNCIKLDRLYKGEYIKDIYTNNTSTSLPAGRYCFDIGYNQIVRFSTIESPNSILDESGSYVVSYKNTIVPVGNTITYNTDDGLVVVESGTGDVTVDAKISNVSSTKCIIDEDAYLSHSAEDGTLNTSTGEEETSTSTVCRTGGFISVFPKIKYEFFDEDDRAIDTIDVYYYDTLNKYISHEAVSGNSFTTPEMCYKIRIVKGVSAAYLNASNPKLTSPMENDYYVFDGLPYKKLADLSTLTHDDGKTKGIVEYMTYFSELSDSIFEVHYPAAQEAQKAVTTKTNELSETLGDMYREGWWEDDSYVLGDEKRLYDDGVKNIEEVCKPSNSYNIGFLDLYGSNVDNYVAEQSPDAMWQDITIMSAVHLLDEEIGINTWAYIDKIKKCYDQPWKTSLTLNTNLSTVSQHSFTDVMTNIANVVKSFAGKQSLYDRAANLTAAGSYDANMLEGTIDANVVKLTGGSSSWYTDENGNMIFEAADGSSAMTLNGNGFMIASAKDEFGKWIWRTFGTGEGFIADEIVAGHINADLINAGSITADLLSSNVGKELDITSNKQINMIVSGATPVGAVKTSGVEIMNDTINILSSGSINIDAANKIHIGTGSSASTLQSELESKYNIATISLYKDAASDPLPPANSHTYNFANQSFVNEGTEIEEWSTIYPTTIQDKVYITTAKISSNSSTTKNVTSSDWSAPTLYVKNGRDGTSFNIKGSKTSYDLLPDPSTQEIGDAYIISGGSDPETEGHIFIVTDNGSGHEWTDGGKIQGEKGTDGRSMISMVQQYILSAAEPTPYANWQNTIPEKTSSDANKQYYSRYLVEWAGNEAKTFYNGDMPGFNSANNWHIPDSSRIKTGLKYNIVISLDEPSEYNVDFYFRQSSITRNKIGHLDIGDTTSTFDAIGYSNVNYIRQTASSSDLTYHLTITSYDNTYSWTDPIVAVDINNAEQAKKDAAAAAISAANAETKAQESLTKSNNIIDGTVKAKYALLMDGTKISINPEEKVNVKSGGLIDIAGGKLNIASGSSIDMAANSDMNLAAGGSINILSGQTQSGIPTNAIVMNNQGIAVESDGMIVVDGGEIVVKDDNNNALVMNDAGIVIDSGAAVVIKDGLNDAITMDDNGIALSSDAKIELTSGNEIVIASSSSSHTGNAVTIDGEGIALAADGKIDIGANSSIDVTSSGAINVSSGGNIDISSTGTFTIDSTNFSIDSNGDVSITGNVEAETGNIGGWNINSSALVSSVTTTEDDPTSYATGMSPIRLNGTVLQDTIVFYAGEVPELGGHYPFEVHSDGSVYLTKLYLQTGVDAQGNPVYRIQNITQYPMWKLSSANLKDASLSNDGKTLTITKFSGGDINFNKADAEIDHASASMTAYDDLGVGTGTIIVYGTSEQHGGSEVLATLENMIITATPAVNAGKALIGLSSTYGSISVTDAKNAPKTLTITAPTAQDINDALTTDPYRYTLNILAGEDLILTRVLNVSSLYNAAYKKGWNDCRSNCTVIATNIKYGGIEEKIQGETVYTGYRSYSGTVYDRPQAKV